MHFSIIVKILGILLMLFSFLSNLPPMLVALIYRENTLLEFGAPLVITFSVGLALFLLTFRSKEELHTRDGFLVVTLFWTVLGTFGCLPFLFVFCG